MDRFVAFVWDQRLDALRHQVARWARALEASSSCCAEVLDRPGLRVFVIPREGKKPHAAAFETADGLVVGSMFERGRGRDGRIERLAPETVARIVASRGEELFTRFWGSFVAIWHEPDSGAVHVARDPCGAMSCFTSRFCEVGILCSHVADLAALPELGFSVDWNAVRAFLVHNHFITQYTGLEEVRELLPGQRMTWRPGVGTAFAWMWNPALLAESAQRQSFGEAQEELRAIADDCFNAWGKSHSNIVVRMSGGLDSSIVATLTRRACTDRVTGIHFVGHGYEAYELALARLAARHAGIDLLELELDHSTSDLAPIIGPKLARPTKQILGGSADARIVEAGDALGAGCIMTGHGGDGLFLQRSIAVDAFADYVRLNGLGRDFWRLAYETAVLLQRPIWSVLAAATSRGLGQRKWDPLAFLQDADALHKGLAAPEAIRAIPQDYLAHDWLLAARGLPPCKAEQLRSIVALRDYHPLLEHGVKFDAVQPLISQPIVEFSLRTPAYVFGDGGKDRALERQTFRDATPPEIARRFHKGFINHHLTQDLAANASMLREFVLDGYIVTNGATDRARVEQLFSDEHIVAGDSLGAIMDLVSAEAWLVAWRSDPALRAA